MVPNFTEAYKDAKNKSSAAAKEEWESMMDCGTSFYTTCNQGLMY